MIDNDLLNQKLNALPSKAIARWAAKHPGKIEDADYSGGYCTVSGAAYDILLSPGWSAYGDCVHTIIEETTIDTISQLNSQSLESRYRGTGGCRRRSTCCAVNAFLH